MIVCVRNIIYLRDGEAMLKYTPTCNHLRDGETMTIYLTDTCSLSRLQKSDHVRNCSIYFKLGRLLVELDASIKHFWAEYL